MVHAVSVLVLSLDGMLAVKIYDRPGAEKCWKSAKI